MPGTTTDRDQQRATRWLNRTGGMAYVPPEAFWLLTRRLAARRHAAIQSTPFWVLTIAVYSTLLLDHGALGTPGWSRALESRLIGSYAIAALGRIAYEVLSQRADRRIAGALTHRVSRGTAVSIPMMLGRARMIYVITLVTTEAVFAIVLIALRVGWVGWAFLAAFVVACGLAGVGMSQTARRATVATDPVSLAIDERLRAEDAFRATGPLWIIVMAVVIWTQTMQITSLLIMVAPAILLILTGMQWWALQHRPWPRLPPWPGPWPAAPPGEVGA